MGMFDFLADVGNYDERKVERYEKDGLFVSTCRTSDSSKLFETAVAHPDYNNGKIIVVEDYDTIEEAKKGHKQWVNKMLNNPPRQLVDVSSSCFAELLRERGWLPPFEKAVK